ncbi:hypothetical protein EYF80_003333 [Liparis tanakae]|uniref:Uncharacterized protein n=1 Tax=Liparis tanakae TaxID=230148 RepID=A0A4Z2JA27_9TELE|nr:hypothetical protein EYF80_003333 [Liparis tanakae]
MEAAGPLASERQLKRNAIIGCAEEVGPLHPQTTKMLQLHLQPHEAEHITSSDIRDIVKGQEFNVDSLRRRSRICVLATGFLPAAVESHHPVAFAPHILANYPLGGVAGTSPEKPTPPRTTHIHDQQLPRESVSCFIVPSHLHKQCAGNATAQWGTGGKRESAMGWGDGGEAAAGQHFVMVCG